MFVFSELGPPSDLFIEHQRNSFSFLPLHQLPIATPQHPVVCFWGFLNIFMWAAGIACGGGVDWWSTVLDGDSSEASKRLEVKVKRSKKAPQHCAGVLHSWWFEGFSLSAPAFWSAACTMINCSLTLDTQCQTYTHLTRTSILQQFVFLCVNPHRWTPAVRFCVSKAEDSRTKTANASVHLN